MFRTNKNLNQAYVLSVSGPDIKSIIQICKNIESELREDGRPIKEGLLGIEDETNYD